MQLQVDIEFDQLVRLVKKLPKRQWTKLKQEVENEKSSVKSTSDLERLLLSAPTFTKKQIDELAKTRKVINQWRTK